MKRGMVLLAAVDLATAPLLLGMSGLLVLVVGRWIAVVLAGIIERRHREAYPPPRGYASGAVTTALLFLAVLTVVIEIVVVKGGTS